ncbi:MAG TPA: transporter substrate-binding domain-containing protein [Xanthobacteraceae bacterium]|nr:transporter substrate-binding domain-containing protein [Xanthobacteraceae bacterium]
MHMSAMIAALTGALTLFAAPCCAQTPQAADAAATSQRELVVGTKEAAPFAMKAADGSWSGISIDLWRRIADDLHLHYRLAEEADVQALIDGVAAGRFDMAVAALTVTAEREKVLDFTQVFYVTGLGIAVPVGGEASWQPIIHTLTSFGFAQAILALIGLALGVGLLIWFFERRHNADFGGGTAKGISSGVWWTAMTMTQRGAGSFGPRTLPGRVVAVLWMIGSIVTIAVFTAGITSALTIKHLQGAVRGISDLSAVRVGAVAGTATENTLSRMQIRYRTFANPQDGLNALRARRLDALVYDKPLLAWLVRQNFASSIELIDATFEPQEYAFAVPINSPLRKSVGVAILEAIHSEWWEATTFRYLGAR